ncbi:MAG: LLM class flavin-dependent oxidoreductase [Microbacterium sp.]
MSNDAPRTLPVIALRFDLRGPDFGPSHAELFAGMLELAEYADRSGIDRVHVSEHHHATDGYLPSVFPALAAVAARTRRVRIRPSLIVLPLHDPIRVAEDAAVVDNISGGRLDVTVGAGYREIEFRMLGRSFHDRGTRLRRGVEALRQAWTGEPFEFEGRPVLVRPLPVQPGGPRLIMGGSTPRTARRAAEVADGYDPASPELLDVYLAECAALGKEPGEHLRRAGPFFLHVAEDPERERALLARHVQHEMQQYASWSADSAHIGRNAPDVPLESVWRVGSHQVLTPDEAIELIGALPGDSLLTLNPLAGGTPPALAQESLRLIVERVLPAVAAAAAR